MTHTTHHTPGPWVVAYYASQDGQGGSSHYSAKVGSKTIARTINQVATPTDEANIRLIAAAPALYEALKAMIVEWDRHGCCDSRDVVYQAQQALAQAEGKQ